jgi:hypothetical protein
VIADDATGIAIGDELELLEQPARGKGVVGRVPVDAEIACVRAADARQHRDEASQRRPATHECRRLDLDSAFRNGRYVDERRARAQDSRPFAPAAQNVVDQRLVAVEHDIIEEAEAILPKAPCVWAADDGDRSRPSKHLGERVREQAGRRVRADEDNVEIPRQESLRIALPPIGCVMNPVAELPTPGGDELRSETDELLSKEEPVDEADRLANGRVDQQLKNTDAQRSHDSPLLCRGA